MPDKSVMITIRIRKLKQHEHESIELSLSGFLPSDNPLDFIGWLDKHVQNLTGHGLREIVGKVTDEQTKGILLWPYSTDSMSQMVKRRMRWAGLPSHKIGFHSLRQGFLSVALNYQQSKGNSSNSVMEQAAMFAVWTPFGRVQYGYLKNITRRTKPTTNFIGLTDTAEKCREASFVPEGETAPHINSLDFHLCDLKPYQGKRRFFSSIVLNPLRKKLWHANASKAANSRFLRNSYNWCLVRIGQEALEKAETDPDMEDSLAKLLAIHNAKPSDFIDYPTFRRLGFWIVDARTLADRTQGELIAEDMYQRLKKAHRIPERLPDDKETDTEIPALNVATVRWRDGTVAIKRREWTVKENRIFLECLRGGTASVKQISQMLKTRTQAQVFDHLRALNKRRAKSGKDIIHIRWKSRRLKQSGIEPPHISTDELIDTEHSLISTESSKDGTELSEDLNDSRVMPMKQKDHIEAKDQKQKEYHITSQKGFLIRVSPSTPSPSRSGLKETSSSSPPKAQDQTPMKQSRPHIPVRPSHPHQQSKPNESTPTLSRSQLSYTSEQSVLQTPRTDRIIPSPPLPPFLPKSNRQEGNSINTRIHLKIRRPTTTPSPENTVDRPSVETRLPNEVVSPSTASSVPSLPLNPPTFSLPSSFPPPPLLPPPPQSSNPHFISHPPPFLPTPPQYSQPPMMYLPQPPPSYIPPILPLASYLHPGEYNAILNSMNPSYVDPTRTPSAHFQLQQFPPYYAPIPPPPPPPPPPFPPSFSTSDDLLLSDDFHHLEAFEKRKK